MRQFENKKKFVLPLLALFYVLNSSDAYAWSLVKSVGKVSFKEKGKKTTLNEGSELKAGHSIMTQNDGKVFLKEGDSEIWIGPDSEFSLGRLADSEKSKLGRLDVLKGKLRAKFKKPLGPEAFPYEVKARSVVAGVRGTEFFVDVQVSEEKICTLEGLVRVTSIASAAESWDVSAGHGLFVKPNEMPKVRETSIENQKKWLEATSF